MQKLDIRGMAVSETAGLTAAARGKSGERDLALARVLYRLGDYQGLGEKILQRIGATSAVTTCAVCLGGVEEGRLQEVTAVQVRHGWCLVHRRAA